MSAEKKNVIWIFGDQHRGQMLACNGDPNAVTPNLDFLARTGVNFQSAYCGFPLCSPFRGSLLTSQYPHKCVPGLRVRMPENMKTIAHVMNENGYRTAYVGKWHLDGQHDNYLGKRSAHHIVPPERRGGFQYWVGYENNNYQYDVWVHGGEGDDCTLRKLDGFETDALTDIMLEYIENRDREVPFFAVLSVQPPHDPYIAPPEYLKRHPAAKIELRPNVPCIETMRERVRQDLAGAYAMVENLDYNVGRIIEKLKSEGIYEDTHVMYFSDHGDMHGSHGQFKKNTAYEEAMRIPFIISGGKILYEGWKWGENDVLINHVDIAPTTLGLCGIEKPDWMKGKDLSWTRMKQRDAEGYDTAESIYIQSVIPLGHGHCVDKPWRGVITQDKWKYVCLPGMAWLLYNLKEDPYEQVNLAHLPIYEAKRKELNELLRQWIIDTEDEFELPD